MAKPNKHPIWTIPGMSIFCVLFDILHTVDLGICAHVLGSILDELMRDHTFGNNQAERLDTVWGYIRRVYSDDKVGNRLGHLKLSMFMSDKNNFAVLHCKGNEARHLLPVLCKFLQEHHDPTDGHKVHRLAAATYLVRYYGLVNDDAVCLAEDVVGLAQDCIRKFLYHYNCLSNDAIAAKRLTWQVTIKFHYFDHSADTLPLLNPKRTSTYMFESFIGKLAKVGRAASDDKPAADLGHWLMQKITIAWETCFRHAPWENA